MTANLRDALEQLQALAAVEERRVAGLEEELTVLRAKLERERQLQARLAPLHRLTRWRRLAFAVALLGALGLTVAAPRLWPWRGLAAGQDKPAYRPPPSSSFPAAD